MKWIAYVLVQTLLIVIWAFLAMFIPVFEIKVLLIFATLFFLVRTMFNPEYIYRRLSVFLVSSGVTILIIPQINFDLLAEPKWLSVAGSVFMFLQRQEPWVGGMIILFGVCFGILDTWRLTIGNGSISIREKPHLQILSLRRVFEERGAEHQRIRLDAVVSLYNPLDVEIILTNPRFSYHGFVCTMLGSWCLFLHPKISVRNGAVLVPVDMVDGYRLKMKEPSVINLSIYIKNSFLFGLLNRFCFVWRANLLWNAPVLIRFDTRVAKGAKYCLKDFGWNVQLS